jgi:(p)ppGpp synthase/HD superfamily hydrolase
MAAYSRLFDRALVLAAIVHQDMPRKGTVIPYVIHPVHVATILLRHGYGETLAVAALLHDVLEDIDYDNGRVQLAVRATFPAADLPEKIVIAGMYQAAFEGFVAREFPADVLNLVRAVTEPRDASTRPWKERKSSTIARMRDASPEVAVLKAADALHNVRSILEDIDHHGATVLGRFKAAPADTLWYYRELAGLIRQRLDDAPIALELVEATDALGRGVERGDW